MYSVYILKSQKNGKRYVGYTEKFPEQRCHEHNIGTNKWTKNNGPFILIHSEKYEEKSEAIKREHFLKSGVGRKWLDIHLPA
jgi:putative endonuclease